MTDFLSDIPHVELDDIQAIKRYLRDGRIGWLKQYREQGRFVVPANHRINLILSVTPDTSLSQELSVRAYQFNLERQSVIRQTIDASSGWLYKGGSSMTFEPDSLLTIFYLSGSYLNGRAGYASRIRTADGTDKFSLSCGFDDGGDGGPPDNDFNDLAIAISAVAENAFPAVSSET